MNWGGWEKRSGDTDLEKLINHYLVVHRNTCGLTWSDYLSDSKTIIKVVKQYIATEVKKEPKCESGLDYMCRGCSKSNNIEYCDVCNVHKTLMEDK